MIYRLTFVFILMACSSSINAQYVMGTLGNPEDPENVTAWIPKLTAEYNGEYHFGMGEDESALTIRQVPGHDQVVAQLRRTYWTKKGQKSVLKTDYVNLRNVQITPEGKFGSDQYQGEFVTYLREGEPRKGLKITNPWHDLGNTGTWEIGERWNPQQETVYGKYPNASKILISPKELEELSDLELQIMRNEIFARYGFIFKPGGKMEKYFEKQSWYRPQHADVSAYLTTLEKANIKTIKKEEAIR